MNTERYRMWQIVADIRDAHPRSSDDADSDEIIDALIAAGFGDVTALTARRDTLKTEVKMLWASRERLTAERDLAREDCGHQRAMRESIRVELYTFVGLKVAAEAERDALAAQVADVEAEVSEWVASISPMAEWAAGRIRHIIARAGQDPA